jgi:hypothetical protein
VKSNWARPKKVALLLHPARQKVFVLGWWDFVCYITTHLASNEKKRLRLRPTGSLQYLIEHWRCLTEPAVLWLVRNAITQCLISQKVRGICKLENR